MRTARSKQSLRRAGARKEAYARVLIVCEGSKTEPQYLVQLARTLKLSGANIKVIGEEAEGTAPRTIAASAIRLFEEDGDYDFVYCVIDRDTHETFEEAINTIRSRKLVKRDARGRKTSIQANFAAIVSNPCFEYWLLLHFEETTRAFSGNKEVVARLKRHPTMANYTKGLRNVFGITRSRLFGDDGAISRAARARKAAQAAGTSCPITDMDLLVSHLVSLKHTDTERLEKEWADLR